MAYRHAHHIARQARFNTCPVLSVHRNYNMAGQVQWEVLMGQDESSGFKETTAPTRSEAIARAQDVKRASDGFITEIWAQHGRGMILQP